MNEQERTKEVMKIFIKMREMNLGILNFEEMIRFRKICNTYIKTGDPTEGRIKIPGTNRVLHYQFDTTVRCVLKHREETN